MVEIKFLEVIVNLKNHKSHIGVPCSSIKKTLEVYNNLKKEV